ncbi:MAG: TIGR02266 family protein [Myxococcales bacterium]|nr:TIGR02266 family protein [Myxococcales bacterium]
MGPDSRRDGARALDELKAMVSDVTPGPTERPNADPQAACVAGLLVADFVGRDELASKLEELSAAGKYDAEDGRTLRVMSRGMLELVDVLGLEYIEVSSPPEDLVAKCDERREAMLAALDEALASDAAAQVWLHAVRAGSGIVDTLFDLRTLSSLFVTRAEALTAAGVSDAEAQAAGAAELALTLEKRLCADDTEAQRDARELLAKAWQRYVDTYGRVAEAGRLASRGHGTERRFPVLAAVAAHKRSNRSLQSLVPRSRASITALAAVHGAPAGQADADVGERVSQTPESRRAQRHRVELEVGIGSESNFYLGFTENLSAGGVFVATYLVKPIGSSVTLDLTMPDGATMEITGTVKWTRGESTDGWPGMGVQFSELGADEEERIRAFVSMREPIFYDD